MGLLWELFQEHQIGQRKISHNDLAEDVETHDQELTEIAGILEEMTKRIDALEAEVANLTGNAG